MLGHDPVRILPVSVAELHYYCHALLTSMADGHVGLEDYPSTLSCLQRSLRLRGKIGDMESEVGVLGDLAKVYERLGDENRASLEETARKQTTPEEVVP